ncbi:Hypothetical protein SCF082_LOCUS51276 [Durusdinium trenchii]|uniref:Uncharacterized protein n=1 Tax=Durusdinium trenchii TaxID=1381693 RepID=A0ABP0SDG2_9DINO
MEDILEHETPFGDEVLALNDLLLLMDDFIWSERAESIEAFQSKFEGRFLPSVRTILWNDGRDAQAKARVEKVDAKAVDLTEVFMLSKELNLNEVRTLNLWRAALNRGALESELNVSFGDKTYAAAVAIFFWLRDAQMQLLCRLTRLRNGGDELTEEKRFIVRSITDRMLGSEIGLLPLLMKRILSHNAKLNELLSSRGKALPGLDLHVKALQRERRQLAEIIFVVLLDTHVEGDETKELLKVVQSMSSRWVEHPDTVGHAGEASASFETMYSLLFSVALALDPKAELYDRSTRSYRVKPAAQFERAWLEAVNRQLFEGVERNGDEGAAGVSSGSTNGNVSQGLFGGATAPSTTTATTAVWRHDGVLGACYLLWGCFLDQLDQRDFPDLAMASLQYRNRVLNSGFQNRGLSFFRGVLRSPEFLSDELRRVYLDSLHLVAQNLIVIRLGASHAENPENNIEEILPARFVMLVGLKPRSQEQDSRMFGGVPGPSSSHSLGRMAPPGTSNDPLVSDRESLPDSLEDLLGLLRAIFALEPSFVKDFGSLGGSYLQSFVEDVERVVETSDDPHSLYVTYLGFLSSLGSSGMGLVRHLESSRVGCLQWRHLFDALSSFCSVNGGVGGAVLMKQQQQQQQMMMGAGNEFEPRIQLADQLVLACWLAIVNSCSKDPKCAVRLNEICHASTNLQLLDLLSALTLMDLEPALKAQLTWCMANQAPQTRHEAIWTKIQPQLASQVLGNQAALTNGPGMDGVDFGKARSENQGLWPQAQNRGFMQESRSFGSVQQQQQHRQQQAMPFGTGVMGLQDQVKLDLERYESSSHTYPFTTSFLDLMWNVVTQNPDTPSVLLHSFLEFSMDEIFFKLTQRRYRDRGELWRIAAGCLRIFVLVLERYTKDSRAAALDFSEDSGPTSPGFWVMTKVLEGSNFFKQLFDLIELAGGEPGVRNSHDRVHDKYSDSLQNGHQAVMQQQQQQAQSFLAHHPMHAMHQQHQQQQSSGERPWFLVAARKSNCDVRNSSVVQGEPLPPNAGSGMIRVRSRAAAPTHVLYDGGRFSSWLAQPHVHGWSVPLSSPETVGCMSATSMPPRAPSSLAHASRLYCWDDGDLAGAWREYAIKLTIRLLEQVSSRESWFLEGALYASTEFESRLERLHRLFSHRKKRLHLIAGFFRYPYSAEIRLNSIELIFRLSEQAPKGTIVHALREVSDEMSQDLASCLCDEFAMPDLSTETAMSMNPNTYEPMSEKESSRDVDLRASERLPRTILERLIVGLSQPRGNLSHLVLGLHEIASGQARLDSIDLRSPKRTCLTVVLGILDNSKDPNWRNENLIELMLRLVYTLADSSVTGIAISYGLNEQWDQFWLRQFKSIASKPGASDAKTVSRIGWIINGIRIDLRIARAQVLPGVVPANILRTLFSVASTWDVDQAHIRILDILDVVSLHGEQPFSKPDEMQRLEVLADRDGISLWVEPYESNGFSLIDLHTLDQLVERYLDRDTQPPPNQHHAAESMAMTLHDASNLGPASRVKQWAREWNSSQDDMAARSRFIKAWKEVVEFAVVDLREDLVRVCCSGLSDHALLFQFCIRVLRKLSAAVEVPAVLGDHLAALLTSLVAQLHFGDEHTVLPPSLGDYALTAATGSYAMSFRPMGSRSGTTAGGTPAVQGEEVHGLARLSHEELRQLLEDLLDAICKHAQPRASVRPVAGQACTLSMRASLYTAVAILVQGERQRFADAVSLQSTQVPMAISEKKFLECTSEVHDERVLTLRKRAKAMLESLHTQDRGVDVLDLAVSDAMESDEPPTRVIALAIFKLMLECDHDDRWFTSLRKRGVFRHLIGVVMDRIFADRLFSNSQAEKIFELSVSVLTTVAQSRAGAECLVDSEFLSRLAMQPLMVLCDKRALDAWVSYKGSGTDAGGAPGQAGTTRTQEQRFDLVLPLLRLVQTVFVTTKSSCAGSGGNNQSLVRLRQGAFRVLKTQKRMVSSSLGFSPMCLADIEEAILIMVLLSQCASDSALYSRELGVVATEFDELVSDLLQEICCPQRGEWKDVVKPITAPEHARAGELVPAPPDMAPNKTTHNSSLGARDSPTVSLFQLDVFSQQRILLQHVVAYFRARKKALPLKENMGRNDSAVNALVHCLDYSARSLAAVARSSGPAFMETMADPHNTSGSAGGTANSHGQPAANDLTWSQGAQYVRWTCSSLLLVLEGALASLYFRLRTIRSIMDSQGSNKDVVHKWLKHRNLLVSHYDPSHEKSALEQLEDFLQANVSSSQFIHLVLRRMRELD